MKKYRFDNGPEGPTSFEYGEVDQSDESLEMRALVIAANACELESAENFSPEEVDSAVFIFMANERLRELCEIENNLLLDDDDLNLKEKATELSRQLSSALFLPDSYQNWADIEAGRSLYTVSQVENSSDILEEEDLAKIQLYRDTVIQAALLANCDETGLVYDQQSPSDVELRVKSAEATFEVNYWTEFGRLIEERAKEEDE